MGTTVPHNKSLEDVHASVATRHPGIWRRIFAFAGPAYLVSVGYMDPGNWATDLEGGSRFGYALIWVILMSNLMAVLLQTLAARLGIVTGKDLAQACRAEYSRPANFVLWVLCEIAIAACDLAEVLGTILGLNLLFGMPLLWGAVVTLFDTFLLLAIQRLGIRKMEAFILGLISVIALGFVVNLFLARPDWGAAAGGLIPEHNLYLHSALVQTRQVSHSVDAKARACRYNLIDSVVALNLAFFVNAAILVLAAAVFFRQGIVVTEIQQAHHMLDQLVGSRVAPMAFGIALLAAGQSSTLTGTLAGQVVMEGFVRLRLRPWLRRLVTRSLALVPAIVVISISGDRGTYSLLILSQVILSLQLPFAIVPLVHFTSDRTKMGTFASGTVVRAISWLTAALIIGLNGKLVWSELGAWAADGAPMFLVVLAGAGAAAIAAFLVYIVVHPLLRPGRVWEEVRDRTSAAGIVERIASRPSRNIGVALGRDDGDAVVVSQALTVAQAEKALLTLIHVVDSVPAQVYTEDVYDAHTRDDEQYLMEIAEEIRALGVAVEIELLHGDPVRELAAFATRQGLDMLVVGSHGHRMLGDLLFGQTVDPLRHRVDIPVLVAR